MKKIAINISLFLVFFLSGCNKDDDVFIGTLLIEFDKKPSFVSVYDTDYQSRPLFEIDLGSSNKVSRSINMGNYYCIVGNNYPEVPFQIQPNKTTRIIYNDNTYTVSYE